MTKDIDATHIFNRFQSRRDILRRAGRLGALAALPLPLAACLEVPDNAFDTLANGDVAIAINDGQNCWQNQCFRYDAARGEVSAAGYEPMPVPEDVDLSNGRVTEAEFDALLDAARAERRERSSDNGGSGGGGAGGGSGGPGSA